MVRGVYFTSGTQTGTPIDRVLSAIAANFGLGRQGPPPFSGTAKSYLRHPAAARSVVFPEAALAGLDPRLERRRLWLRRGAYAGAALLALLAAAAWTTELFSRNRAYVAEVAGQSAAIERRIESLTHPGPRPARRAAPAGCRPRHPRRLRGARPGHPLVDGPGALPGRQARLPGRAQPTAGCFTGPCCRASSCAWRSRSARAPRTRTISTTPCASI